MEGRTVAVQFVAQGFARCRRRLKTGAGLGGRAVASLLSVSPNVREGVMDSDAVGADTVATVCVC